MCGKVKYHETRMYHETMLDRIWVEGWYEVVLRPSFKSSLKWGLFWVVVSFLASLNHGISPHAFYLPPLLGTLMGFASGVLHAWCGRDLQVREGWHVTLWEGGDQTLREPLTNVDCVEILDGPSNRFTIQIGFTRRKETVRFTTRPTDLGPPWSSLCTTAQQKELVAALTSEIGRKQA